MSEEFDGWDEIDWDIDIDSARFQLHIIEAVSYTHLRAHET